VDNAVFAALDQGRSETNLVKRAKLYNALEKKIVVDEAAWLPMFSMRHLYVVQPKVKKFVVPWNGWFDMPKLVQASAMNGSLVFRWVRFYRRPHGSTNRRWKKPGKART